MKIMVEMSDKLYERFEEAYERIRDKDILTLAELALVTLVEAGKEET